MKLKVRAGGGGLEDHVDQKIGVLRCHGIEVGGGRMVDGHAVLTQIVPDAD